MQKEKSKQEVENNPDNIKALLYLDKLQFLLKNCEEKEIYEECQRLYEQIKI